MADNEQRGDRTLLLQWKDGQEDAASAFHEKYVHKLVSMIQTNLSQRFMTRFDPEDVVQSAMRTFFCAVAEGRQTVTPQDDVWKLLQTIALNKMRNQIRFHSAQKRDERRTVSAPDDLLQHTEPVESDALDIVDAVERTLAQLSPNAAQTMKLILEGVHPDQIAEQLQVTRRSVDRYREDISRRLQLLME